MNKFKNLEHIIKKMNQETILYSSENLKKNRFFLRFPH